MSGFDFAKIWVSNHRASHWQQVAGDLKNGNGTTVADPRWKSYDLRVQYTRKNYEIWEDFGQGIKRITISVLPDKRWQAHYEQ